MSKVRKKILLVDDISINRNVFKGIFAGNYELIEASNGVEAIQQIIKYHDEGLALILLDIKMPVMDGFGVLEYLNENGLVDRIPTMLITGDASAESEMRAYDLGVVDVITKPFDPYVVNKRIENVITLYSQKEKLEKMAESQRRKLISQAKKLQAQKNQLVDTLSTVVEFRNLESNLHVERVRNFTKIILECVAKMYPEYNITEERIESISTASALHDVGKVAIPDSILLKPGKLTRDEFDIIKTHTTKGCEIINHFALIDDKEFFKDCYDISRHHHEKYDGRGYPDGLVGDDIPLSAQVVAIADVYDALVSERIYKMAYSKEKAFDMIVEGDCGVFNPKLMECFKKVRTKLEKMADKLV